MNICTEQGKTDFQNMPDRKERQAAFMAATGKGASFGTLVSITVKDENGNPLTRTFRQDEFICYVFGFALDVGNKEIQ
jgi:hypothetical protein